MNNKKHPDKNQTDTANRAKSSPEKGQMDPKQQAIKFKTFRHIFNSSDINKGIDEKSIQKKLKKSKNLEESYHRYLRAIDADKDNKRVFPWDSVPKRTLFWVTFWIPQIIKWGTIISLALATINYIPGPTQHIVELIMARALYDTAPIKRLPESLENYAHSASIVDAKGTIIKAYGKRDITTDIPEKVEKAVLACEDHYLLPHAQNPWYVNTFLIHPGVSWLNLAGAAKDAFLGKPRGASTIIMQNAKKILGNEKRSIANKLEEIILSYLMVSRFGKEKNLNFYINTVPLGGNIYGFPAAARNFFKKNLDELNIQQLVALGSFIPNHNRLITFYKIVNGKNFDELTPAQMLHARSAINKINLALTYLRELQEISPEEYQAWLLTDEESIRKIGFRNYRSPLYGEEEWTSWNVVKEVSSRSYLVSGREITGAQLLLDERGDVIVETGVDLLLIEKIKEFISEFLNSPKYKKVLEQKNQDSWQEDLEVYRKKNTALPYEDFQGFMQYLFRHINVGVMIINQDGEVIAQVGGKEFLQESYPADQEKDDVMLLDSGTSEKNVIIDLMNKKAKITPSSTIKPITAYYTMVATNVDLEEKYADKPLEYKYVDSIGREAWLPRNWYEYDKPGSGNNRYLGRSYTLMDAQVQSINTIFARLYTDRNIRNSMLIGFDKIGLDYNREDARYWPFGIGASDVPVQQWLGIYNAFLDGYYREPSFVRRIVVNNEVIFERKNQQDDKIMLFDAKKERGAEMLALYEICNRGTASTMKNEFKFHQNLVSGKTGTAPENTSALFVSHFNPYRDRTTNKSKTLTMVVAITTNTGGYKHVGTSGQGPTQIAGKIYNFLFQNEFQQMMDEKIEHAKKTDSHFRNNHIYWANVNRYMEDLLNKKCGAVNISDNIIGIDGYAEALAQILNSNNKIYSGNDELFAKLVEYYCDQAKVVKMEPTED